MTSEELKVYDSMQVYSQHMNYWAPVQWIFILLKKARDKGMIESDIIYVDMLEVLIFNYSK